MRKEYLLTVQENMTWEVKISADSEEEARAKFRTRGVQDGHFRVSDYLLASKTTVTDIKIDYETMAELEAQGYYD
tara:strand:+ start:4685 stop:4909 length:225 start_codon:yes stop_codon:yes gene_type:complete